jgi:hypothetical protein
VTQWDYSDRTARTQYNADTANARAGDGAAIDYAPGGRIEEDTYVNAGD